MQPSAKNNLISVEQIEADTDNDGNAVFTGADLQYPGRAREPAIPHKIVNLLLPPDANASSLHVFIGNSWPTWHPATWSEDSRYASVNSHGYVATTKVAGDQQCILRAGCNGFTAILAIRIEDRGISPSRTDAVSLAGGGGGSGCFIDSLIMP